MNFLPDVQGWDELERLLEIRGGLIRELADAARAEPSDSMLASLQRCAYAGAELTRRLAEYRHGLQNELLRMKRYS
ncbi:MAG: hypothetical protein JO022_12485 [Acidobacteriaceae bacterium]|nr:hypothetical protein [Acidobacteriaceae bacterium]